VKNPLIFRHVLESSTNGGLAYFSERFEAYIAVELLLTISDWISYIFLCENTQMMMQMPTQQRMWC